MASATEFYHGRSILISGGTGFLGKVLLEKLLYQFRDIKTVYLLLRPKAGQLIRTRLDQLIASPCFERIRTCCPEQFSKIIPISGDISYPGLGINPIDLVEVVANVSIIFHAAATIRFDEPLKYALKLNTLGTKRMLELAKRLKELAAFVHVSTAYCTVRKCQIEEKVYKEPIGPDRVLEMADEMDDVTFDENFKDIFYQGRPCSYHYTKSLAEHLVAEEVERGYVPTYHSESTLQADEVENWELIPPLQPSVFSSLGETGTALWRPFPAAIIRPSIITSAWREPFPGWIDNYNGTTGFLVVSGKGVLRTIHANPDYITDMMPVDVVVNACIAAAWYVAVCQPKVHSFSRANYQCPSSLSFGLSNVGGSQDVTEPFVVNCVSGSLNPLTWAQLRDISTPILMKYPSSELFRVPGVRYHRNKALHQLNLLLEHTIPAAVMDFMFRFLGHSPIMNQIYQKVHRTICALEHFTMNEWTYQCDNLVVLDQAVRQSYARDLYTQHQNDSTRTNPERDHLTQLDKLCSSNSCPLAMNIAELDWQEYFKNYVLGIRRYLLKEDPATISQARKTLFILKCITLLSQVAVGGTMAYQLLYARSITRQVLDFSRRQLRRRQS